MLKTPMLTYNVHDRGRAHRGQDRQFDTAALAKLINSPEVQERVKHGDMLGYYGHWPRIKFGMQTQEGGILDGKVVALPTAIRTIHLSADDKGNITHQAEFLDTEAGRIAASLYNSKAGGFSSAIDALPRSFPSIPVAFQGFDYVIEPNYTTNRGYKNMLDAVAAGGEEREEALALLDQVIEEERHAATHLVQVLDSLQAQHAELLALTERLTRENDLLVGMVASGAASAEAVLDSVAVLPRMGAVPDYKAYLDMPVVPLKELYKSQPDNSSEARMLRHRLGIKV